MLGSMNPLVQRVRGGRWGVTVSAYIVSSILGGLAVGLVLGLIGSTFHAALLRPAGHRLPLLILIGMGALGVVLDLGPWKLRLPTTMRQVDEAWRYRYRNWVYATGYGFQIGFGFMTVVTTAAVYTTLAAAVLVGSWQLGAVLGAWFGLARSISVLSVARIDSLDEFDRIEQQLQRWNRPSKVVAVVGQALLALSLIAVVGM